MALRHKLPLQPISSINDNLKSDVHTKVPLYKYDARTVGYETEHRFGTTIPGIQMIMLGFIPYYILKFLRKLNFTLHILIQR